jgi:hypothetical protein
MFLMPYLLWCLLQAAYPTDHELRKATYIVFVRKSPWRWPLRGRKTHSILKRLHRKKKPSIHLQTKETNISRLWTYLVPVAVSVSKVGVVWNNG